MKIAVAGGAGLTGQCAVRDLLRNRSVERIVVCDYDDSGLERLKAQLAKEADSERLQFEKVDVTKHDETSTIIRGCDVVINAVQYYYNLDVLEDALAAGVNYLDFGGLYHTTLKQIAQYHKKFEDADLLAVVGMGAQPGVSNLMVKYALEKLDRADSVEIFDGWRDMTRTSSPMYFTWSPLTFFDESAQQAIVFENGEYTSRPPFSEPQTVNFSKPVGPIVVYLALHSEIATIPRSFESFGIKHVSWKEGGADFWKIKLLADIGLTSAESISVDGSDVVPRRLLLKLLESKQMLKVPENTVPDDFEVTRVLVKGVRGDRKLTVIVDAMFPAYKPWKVSCSQYNVGIPGSIAAQIIAKDRKTLPKGVLPAERVFEPTLFFSELEKRKIRVTSRTVNGWKKIA
jgi:lysine 6-dehydrogenase